MTNSVICALKQYGQCNAESSITGQSVFNACYNGKLRALFSYMLTIKTNFMDFFSLDVKVISTVLLLIFI